MAGIFTVDHERDLIERLIRKEQAAVTELYDRYSAALYGVVLRIVGEEEIAQDKVQEIFVKIWHRIDQYDSSKGRLYTWLINIARNHAIDYTRSKEFKSAGKIQNTENFVRMMDASGSSSLDTDSIGLQKIVSGLDPDLRLIIDYLYFQGYTQAELAEEKGIPLGTVKTRLKIAIRELRKMMG